MTNLDNLNVTDSTETKTGSNQVPDEPREGVSNTQAGHSRPEIGGLFEAISKGERFDTRYHDQLNRDDLVVAVSYTHLTLPTILLV